MTMALMADKVPPAGRQAAFGRVMTASTAAQVLGAAMAGAFAGTLGWRAFFGILAVIAALAMLGAWRYLDSDVTQTRRISVARAVGDYGRILSTKGALLIAAIGISKSPSRRLLSPMNPL
jgi:predicted MFS family arabinose efflux permease